MLPNLIMLSVFVLFPVSFSLFVSLHTWDMFTTRIFLGLGNYTKLFTDQNFHITIKNSAYFVVTTVPMTIIVSLVAATLINNVKRGRKFFQTIVFLPAVTSSIAVSQVFRWLYVPSYGPLSQLINKFGLAAPNFLDDYAWAMPSVIVVGIWLMIAFTSIVYLAALQSIPVELYEAAIVDGAGAWSRFIRITVPLLRNTTFFLTVIITISAFRFFEPIYALTKGGPMRRTDVLMWFIYRRAFLDFRMGYASAASFILFIILIILAIIQRRLLELK
jgi:multiple sugar transport system permease protein